jgi:hypothetical protein
MIDWQLFLLLPAASESYFSSTGRLFVNCGWLCKWQRRKIDLSFFVFMTRRCVHCGSLLWGMPHGPNLGCRAVIKILTGDFIYTPRLLRTRLHSPQQGSTSLPVSQWFAATRILVLDLLASCFCTWSWNPMHDNCTHTVYRCEIISCV